MSGSDVPMGWETRRLSQVVLLSDSGTWGDPGSPADGLPVLRSTNINEWELDLNADLAYRCVPERDRQRKRLQYGDIIVTKSSGSPHLIGEAALFNVRDEQTIYLFSNFTQRLRPDQSIVIPRYLHLYLKSPKARNVIGEMQRTTSGLRNLKLPDYEAQHIPLPYPDDPVRSLETQCRIVARIEALFAELQECRKLHQAVVEDTNRLMDAVRNERFLDLRAKVPTRKFDEIADSRLGKMLSQQSKTGDHLRPYLRNANVLWDEFKLNDLFQMNFAPDEQETYRVVSGDLLICEGGDIGRTAVWDGQIDEVYFQKALHRARLKNPKDSPRYLMHFMAWAARNGAFAELMTGAAIPHLTGIKLKTLDVAWPDADIQYEVVAYLDSVQDEIRAMQEANETNRDLLNQMEQSILAQAFRGEL